MMLVERGTVLRNKSLIITTLTVHVTIYFFDKLPKRKNTWLSCCEDEVTLMRVLRKTK